MIPFITCEIPLCQDVCKLVLGVDVFDLDLRIKINSIEQPIKSNSMTSGNMSHCWTSAFHYHFDHSLIVPQTHTIKLHDLRIEHLREPNQYHAQHRFCYKICFSHSQVVPFDLKHEKHFQRTETIRSHNSRARKPSSLNPVSREIISDSVEL